MKKMRTVLVIKAKDKSEARAALQDALEALKETEEKASIEIKVSMPTKK